MPIDDVDMQKIDAGAFEQSDVAFEVARIEADQRRAE